MRRLEGKIEEVRRQLFYAYGIFVSEGVHLHHPEPSVWTKKSVFLGKDHVEHGTVLTVNAAECGGMHQ